MSKKHQAQEKIDKPLDHLAWVSTGRERKIHCVPDVIDDEGHWPERFIEQGGTSASALCGKAGHFHAPGIFTRLHAQRCVDCCDVLGIQHGYGTPLNERSK